MEHDSQNTLSKDIEQMEENPAASIVLTCVLIAVMSGGIGYYLGMHQQAQPITAQQQSMASGYPSVTPIPFTLESTISYTLPNGWNKIDKITTFIQKSGAQTPLSEILITSPGKTISAQGVPSALSGAQITIVKFINPPSSKNPIQELTDKIKNNGINEVNKTTIDNQPALHGFSDKNHNQEFYLVVQGNNPNYTWNIIVNYVGKNQADIQSQKSRYQPDVQQFLQSINFK